MDKPPGDPEARTPWADNPHLKLVQEQLFRKWALARKHRRRYHLSDRCLAKDSDALHAEFNTKSEQRACLKGEAPWWLRKAISEELFAALRYITKMPNPQRKLFWYETAAAFETQNQSSRHAFGQEEVRQQLIQMGFTEAGSSAILQAAGPNRAVEAVQWAYTAQDVHLDPRRLYLKLRRLIAIQLDLEGLEAAVKDLGLPSAEEPSLQGLISVIKGAHAALIEGLPPLTKSDQSS